MTPDWLIWLYDIFNWVNNATIQAVEFINPTVWVIANLTIVYISIALIVFVIGYYVLFDPKATTGGKLIYRFGLSLIGVIALIIIGTFGNPAGDRTWYTYPGDILWWRPVFRLLVYGYIAYTITNLTILLGFRKWNPSKLRTARDFEIVHIRDDKTI